MPELVADEEEPQAVLAQHLERLVGHVGLGVARPGDAEPPEPAGDLLRPGAVVGEGVVVEEELLHLRELALGKGDLIDYVPGTPRAVAVAADGLGPEAEGAARFAAAPGVEREIGMEEIADEIVLDHEVALVDLGDPGQRVHVLDDGPLGVVHHRAVHPVADTVDLGQRAALGDLLDGEIELAARDEIDGLRGGERGAGRDRDMRPHHADEELRIGRLEGLDHLHVGGEGGCRGMEHQELDLGRERQHVLEREPPCRRIDEPASGYQGRRLGEPGRVPEGADLALGLVARARTAVEALVGGRIEK